MQQGMVSRFTVVLFHLSLNKKVQWELGRMLNVGGTKMTKGNCSASPGNGDAVGFEFLKLEFLVE